MTWRTWTDEENTFLRQTHTTHTIAAQASALNRTYQSIAHQRRRLGLAPTGRREYKLWTENDAVLIDLMLSSGSSVTFIARKLKRSVNAVHTYVRQKGWSIKAIRRSPVARVWTAIEVARLFGVSGAMVTVWIDRKWLRAVRNNAGAQQRRQRAKRRAPQYLIHDEAIQALIERRETWPAWEPRAMTDAGWRSYAEEVRAAAGGRWLSTAEVAARMGYSVASVKYWRLRGKFAGVASTTYDGRHYYWSADLDDWQLSDRRVTKEAI